MAFPDEYKDFKVTKIPRNGPKPGQSSDAWVHGKTEGFKRDEEKRRARQWRHRY